MKNKVAELVEQIREVAYELETCGVAKAAASKEAAPSRLYKYELDGFVFYTSERNPQGFRLPTGRAKWTKEYFPVSGPLAKDVSGEASSESDPMDDFNYPGSKHHY